MRLEARLQSIKEKVGEEIGTANINSAIEIFDCDGGKRDSGNYKKMLFVVYIMKDID